MTKLKELKKRFMEDPEFREAYASVDKEFTLVETRVRERAAENLIRSEGTPHSNAGKQALFNAAADGTVLVNRE